ncbi:MAG TPA: HoxN/HupN/NixA family nickel/cobalt transporter [Candidatus Cybelea sp.]|nr:HoxN/HupN/NixA family nickel/cobalt transporter [Candidatus Cybelea sp.]
MPAKGALGKLGAPRSTRAKIFVIYVLLLGANAAVWVLAFLSFAPPHTLLLGTALLAYTFGLRHAVDADHICAIDNVTRKLMQDGKRPVAVGFFFSLGHSTIVVALTVAIAIGATAIKGVLPSLEGLGSIVGTGISAVFLFIIAAINAFVLVDIVRAARRLNRGAEFSEQTLDDSLAQRGLLGRFFQPLLRLVKRSSDMYPIGVLFGLGFDTATEVGLLGIAAIEAGKGLPIVAILIFPALFAAGMSLVDTSDGILMLGAYGWAFINPARKLYYNVAITGASVLVAVLVGGIELTSIAGNGVALGWAGFAIVGIFAIGWLVAAGLHAASNGNRAPIKGDATAGFDGEANA